MEYLKQKSAEGKARRADEKARTEEYGFPYAKSPIEQADLAQQSGNRDVAQTTAEGVLREGSQGGAMDLDSLREGFDPSNAESVRQMQRMMNQAGFTGADGQPLAEDGRFGPQSLAALRKMQGGHRDDNATLGDLSDRQYGVFNQSPINTRGKEELYSREGRGQSTRNTPKAGFAGDVGLVDGPEFSPNTLGREQRVGAVRGGAKGIDDAIEQSAPWLAESAPYRGAKEGIKKFFNWAGDSDY
tara:strand:- start:15278 stop:16006 length:729 start_codon:yes stop_codon:yes gene_type:complete